jgi:hypothetical protein
MTEKRHQSFAIKTKPFSRIRAWDFQGREALVPLASREQGSQIPAAVRCRNRAAAEAKRSARL